VGYETYERDEVRESDDAGSGMARMQIDNFGSESALGAAATRKE